MPSRWRELGRGSYNTAYVDDSRQRVLKIQHSGGDASDDPVRSVRVWNEMNLRPPPPDSPLTRRATLYSSAMGNGWVCPYIEGRQSSDDEMAQGLIGIYNRTGRVVADATARENFITTPDGEVVCIDIGMALRLQRFEREAEDRALLERSGSVVSFDTWSPVLKENFQPFFDACSRTNPVTVRTVKALLFIQQNRPDIFNVDFLSSDEALRDKLAQAYDDQHRGRRHDSITESLESLDSIRSSDRSSDDERLSSPVDDERLSSPVGDGFILVEEAEEALRDARPINLDNIKESYMVHIDRYINSRGTITVDGNTESLESLDSIRSSDDERLSSPVDDERLSSPVDDRFILVEEAKEALRDARPINLDNIKESCMVHIDRYINSRGTITVDGNFDPSWVTKIFRNQRTTLDKVAKMVDLKSAIDSATSYDDIRKALDTLLSDESAVKATFGSGVKRALERCLSSVEVGEKGDPELHNAHQASP